MDAIVASMLTTTPFLSPRDGCVPMPITLSAPSGPISATIAAIFDVPMSRPTIKFFSFTIRPPPSLGICLCPSLGLGSRFPRRLFAKARHARRKSIAVTQIHLLDVATGACQRSDRAIVHGDEAREPTGRIVAAELDRQRSLPIRRSNFPTAPRRQRQCAHGQSERRE